MKCLQHPIDSEYILKKKKAIRRELLSRDIDFTDIKLAVLGGSTTAEIKNILELFLLGHGILPEFYESAYGGYWRDAMFSDELKAFKPDVTFIHTTNRNITAFPNLQTGKKQVDEMLTGEYNHFAQMWDSLLERGCSIIQNNFERPHYRLLGNKDISDYRGHSSYISRLNQMFYEYAASHAGFYINDIDYLSGWYGLRKWRDLSAWYMYKYALGIQAIPTLAYSVANIVKSIYGKNKKVIALDLDNTLWGGVIGDDGTDGIELGPGSAEGEAYLEFQEYIKSHADLGIALAVCSKNDEENALAGLNHPVSRLMPDDFASICANWENKDRNIQKIAQQLNIGIDSIVVIDDNPAERELIADQLPGVAVPDIQSVEDYIHRIDMSGFFEPTVMSKDDAGRVRMYKENALRMQAAAKFQNYEDYLLSLEMSALIRDFDPSGLGRITQLINKTNQFNLTTKRYSESEIKAIAADDGYIRLYGSLIDKFGDNGIVSVIIGSKDGSNLHIDLWVMSCRVFKRDLEYAMMDCLAEQCIFAGIKTITGYYYPTAKNGIVSGFYGTIGFKQTGENEGGITWQCDVSSYTAKNKVIKVNE